MPNSIPHVLRDFLRTHRIGEQKLVVGVSGGADSLALLHVLLSLRGPLAARTLYVAHLDHGFRGEAAEQDAEFVGELATSLGLPCTVERFDVPSYARERGYSDEQVRKILRQINDEHE